MCDVLEFCFCFIIEVWDGSVEKQCESFGRRRLSCQSFVCHSATCMHLKVLCKCDAFVYIVLADIVDSESSRVFELHVCWTSLLVACHIVVRV